MFELDCSAVFPGCNRVIRAESRGEVMRRAVAQAKALGVEQISPMMLDMMRDRMIDRPDADTRAA